MIKKKNNKKETVQQEVKINVKYKVPSYIKTIELASKALGYSTNNVWLRTIGLACHESQNKMKELSKKLNRDLSSDDY